MRHANPDVPDWLESLVAKLHAKNPADRYQSADEVAALLRRHVEPGGEPSTTGSWHPSAEAPAHARHGARMLLALAGVGCLVLAASVVSTLWGPVSKFFTAPARDDAPGRAAAAVPGDRTMLNQTSPVKASEKPPNGPGKGKRKGVVSLFNAKDLAGWKKFPDRKGEWTVEKGVLVGRGPVALLFSERADYRDFTLLVEAKVNASGSGGVFVRTPEFKLIGRLNDPEGLKAIINPDTTTTMQTGCLHTLFQGDIRVLFARLHKPRPRAEEWFKLEITARGPDITVALNGEKGLTFQDDTHGDARGFLVLQVLGAGGEISFRRIEIKE
jgi:hypothetical protein